MVDIHIINYHQILFTSSVVERRLFCCLSFQHISYLHSNSYLQLLIFHYHSNYIHDICQFNILYTCFLSVLFLLFSCLSLSCSYYIHNYVMRRPMTTHCHFHPSFQFAWVLCNHPFLEILIQIFQVV